MNITEMIILRFLSLMGVLAVGVSLVIPRPPISNSWTTPKISKQAARHIRDNMEYYISKILSKDEQKDIRDKFNSLTRTQKNTSPGIVSTTIGTSSGSPSATTTISAAIVYDKVVDTTGHKIRHTGKDSNKSKYSGKNSHRRKKTHSHHNGMG